VSRCQLSLIRFDTEKRIKGLDDDKIRQERRRSQNASGILVVNFHRADSPPPPFPSNHQLALIPFFHTMAVCNSTNMVGYEDESFFDFVSL